MVSSTFTLDAQESAEAVSTFASGLTADSTFSNDISNQTFTSTGSLTVVNVDGDVKDTISFSGSATDFFVVNVAGQVDSNNPMELIGGVGAGNILWNLTSTSGECFKTSGGNKSYGTFLATNGCRFQFSNLDLTGALINTGAKIQHVSGSTTEFASFEASTVAPIPLPAAGWLLLGGLGGLAAMRRKKR